MDVIAILLKMFRLNIQHFHVEHQNLPSFLALDIPLTFYEVHIDNCFHLS